MKKKNVYPFILILISIFSASCSKGLTFSPATTNKPLPAEFRSRSVFPDDMGGGYNFGDFVGAILLMETKPIMIGQIRPANFTNKVETVTNPNFYYKSRIQKGAEVGGSYLAFAASFTAEDMAELELVDAAYSAIVYNDTSTFPEIIKKAEEWVRTHPKGNNSAPRIWIKEITLTTKMFSTFSKVDANAEGVITPAVGVKTGVYSNNEDVVKSIILGFVAYDIDKMVAHAKNIESITGKSEEVERFSLFPSQVISDFPTIKTSSDE